MKRLVLILSLILCGFGAFAQKLSETEKQVIAELNRLRKDPARFAKENLEPMLKYFSGNQYKKPGEVTMITTEGAAAVKEAIQVLLKTNPLPRLNYNKILTAEAQFHATSQGPTGSTGHTRTNGTDVFSNLRKRGLNHGSAGGEAISYGAKSAVEIVCQLLIDDGVSSRGHRKILLSRATHVGVGFAPHKSYRHECVIIMLDGIRE